ncbi:putative Response regulator/GGDEF domain protein [Candidatus Terasakiella magnetica]|uniref:Putative Response regulator/GGDEF domain protein n=1 Tax=Candidatus Terasakiella magnetica TaxID=1867952 RepID=A0A1C3RC04_9PROT|nr:diguanylate cyclase [Candidatus Terasakiella magnetica]SCA54816.1 putative Response regulator/GGDEF domain protein [Candidatus Terasakiella magnetica]
MSSHRIANIIVASTNTENLEKFATRLEKYHYTVLGCDNSALMTKATTAHPDLIVIDVTCDDFDGFELVNELKSDERTSHLPVVVLAEQKSDNLYARAIDVRADDVFIHSFDIQEFFIHIKPLLRLSTMYMELDNRVKLAKSMGVDASNEVSSDEGTRYQILLIAPKDGDRATIEAVLDGNCHIDICEDFFAAEDQLTTGLYDAAICALDENNMENVLSLSSRARNNPRLFNLPMLVISDGNIKDRMDAYRRGVTRIVRRPLNQSSLKAKLKMLVRRQRLRWNVRKAMDTTRQSETLEEVSNAYSKDFFTANLTNQIENAHKWQKNLTVVFFSIPNIPNLREQFSDTAAEHLIQQIHQWIGSLTRVEDTVALFGDHEFCIALPDTPLEEAQIVMHRIAGILSYTDFAIVDVFQPISIWVESGITSVELGDDVDILVKRARKNID